MALTRLCGPLLFLAAGVGWLNATLAGGLYLTYVAILIALQGRFFSRMGSGDLLWAYPFFDWMMAAYYAVFVPLTLGRRTGGEQWR